MSPPQTNATLSRVQAPGAGEAVDGPPAPGPSKWQGAADVYVRERRRRARQGETGNVLLERIVICSVSDPAIDWRVGDVLTFSYPKGSPPQTGDAVFVGRPTIDDPLIPDDLKTVRVELAPA